MREGDRDVRRFLEGADCSAPYPPRPDLSGGTAALVPTQSTDDEECRRESPARQRPWSLSQRRRLHTHNSRLYPQAHLPALAPATERHPARVLASAHARTHTCTHAQMHTQAHTHLQDPLAPPSSWTRPKNQPDLRLGLFPSKLKKKKKKLNVTSKS